MENQKTIKERNEDMVYEFFTLCNAMGNSEDLADEFKKRLDREHRTIIQSAMSVIKSVIEHYAKEHGSDLRNKASLDWARKVAELQTHFPYI